MEFKKAITILLAVLVVASLTAVTVSAKPSVTHSTIPSHVHGNSGQNKGKCGVPDADVPNGG